NRHALYTLSEADVHGIARSLDLSELFHAPFRTRHPRLPVCPDRDRLRTDLGVLPAVPKLAAHAVDPRFRAGHVFHLACREYRHFHDRLDLSAPSPGMGICWVWQIRFVVSANDH